MKKIKAYLLILILPFLIGAHFGSENGNGELFFSIGYSAKIFESVSVTDATAAIQILIRKITASTGLAISASSQIYHDNETIVDALNYRDLDVIAILPHDYLSIQTQVDIEPYLIAEARGSFFDEYLLLVRAGDGIASLKDLADKRIRIHTGDEGELPGIWLDVLLLREKLPKYPKFFAEAKKVQSESQAALAVFFGQADAAVITQSGFDTLVELNPQIGQKLFIFLCSPAYANGLCCINRKLSSEKNRELLGKALCDLHLTPEGRQIFTLFKMSRFHPFNDSYLESTRSLLKEYEVLTLGSDGAQ